MMAVASFEKVFLDQVCDNFSVGFGRELVTLFDQLLLQAEIVLDDAVVYDDNLAGAVAMRMGILFRGTSVSSPPGVAYAITAVERFEADNFFQIAQLAFGAADLQLVPIAGNGNSGRVITSVFKPAQALNNNRDYFLSADITYNATHAVAPEIQTPTKQRNSSITALIV